MKDFNDSLQDMRYPVYNCLLRFLYIIHPLHHVSVNIIKSKESKVFFTQKSLYYRYKSIGKSVKLYLPYYDKEYYYGTRCT